MNRYRTGEALVFSVATVLILVHALDDAFLHRGPGLGISQHALAGGISAAACVAAVLAFPSLRPGLRSALAFAFGGLACVNGVFHLAHVVDYGPADLGGRLRRRRARFPVAASWAALSPRLRVRWPRMRQRRVPPRPRRGLRAGRERPHRRARR